MDEDAIRFLFIKKWIAENYILEDWLEKMPKANSILRDKNTLLIACKSANLTVVATNRLILKYIDGLSLRKIAELECVEEATISQSIRRSKRKLHI